MNDGDPPDLTIVQPGAGPVGELGSIVTDGEIGFRTGDREVVLGQASVRRARVATRCNLAIRPDRPSVDKIADERVPSARASKLR
jgi:hypothetical protein